MEHHLSLVLANKAIKTAKSEDKEKIKKLCQEISNEFDNRWEAHFIKEEFSIFSVFEEKYYPRLITNSPDDATLTEKLREQHNQMRTMSAAMRNESNGDQLAEFGILLRDHTRLEERRLFPLVSALFTKEELKLVEISTAHH